MIAAGRLAGGIGFEGGRRQNGTFIISLTNGGDEV